MQSVLSACSCMPLFLLIWRLLIRFLDISKAVLKKGDFILLIDILKWKHILMQIGHAQLLIDVVPLWATIWLP